MALMARERKILILAVAAVGILVLNQSVLSPMFQKRTETRQARETLKTQVEQAAAVLERKKLLLHRWTQMQESGLGRDVQKAEAMVYRFIEDASAGSGLEVGSVQPDRLSTEGQLGQIDFIVAASGSMTAVTRFLWEIETVSIPLKIKSYQLGSKNETAEDMTLQLELSTVYVKEQAQKKKES